jgi:hypothetical protein
MARLLQQPDFEESFGRLRKKIYKIPQQPRKTNLFPLNYDWTALCFNYMAFNRILDFSNGLDFYLGFFFFA